MKKYLLALFLTISLPLLSTTIKANEVYESNTDESIFHVAIYGDGSLYVLTDLEGPSKGIQQIFYRGNLIASSPNSCQCNTFFLHRYPSLMIYSYDEEQHIAFNKNCKDLPCSVLNKVKKRS